MIHEKIIESIAVALLVFGVSMTLHWLRTSHGMPIIAELPILFSVSFYGGGRIERIINSRH
jgi:hypothetical protein